MMITSLRLLNAMAWCMPRHVDRITAITLLVVPCLLFGLPDLAADCVNWCTYCEALCTKYRSQWADKAALNHSDSCAQVQVAGQYPGNIANILSTNTVCNSIVHVVDQVRGFSTMKSISNHIMFTPLGSNFLPGKYHATLQAVLCHLTSIVLSGYLQQETGSLRF
jgi:hypothetical protein